MLYLVLAIAVVALAALAMWQPDPDGSWGWVLRSMGVTLIGGTLLIFGVHGMADLLGLRAFGNFLVVFYLVAGFLALCALFRFRFYWKMLEVWPFFQDMTDVGRSRAIAVIGGLFLFVGVNSLVGVLRADDWCRSAYATARTVADSQRVDAAVPDSSLRMPRGRLHLNVNRPFSCEELRTE